jgi:hypothetical protein
MPFPRCFERIGVAALSALSFAGCFASGCGGGNSSTPAPTASVSVAVAPGSATVQASQTQSFTATVLNDTQNKGTTWTLSGAGCTAAACGTLSGQSTTSGAPITYTAPAAVPNPPTVTLTSTSVADSTKNAKATITLTSTSGATAISIVVAPTMASVATGSTQAFSAALQNDSKNKGVNWTLSGTSCTGSACGAVSPSSSASGVSVNYTAPAAIPTGTITLTATSVADNSKTAAATITVVAPSPSVTVAPPTINLATGGIAQAFTATVLNDTQNQGVNWTLAGANCASAGCGSVSTAQTGSGVAVTYTSAAKATAAGAVTLTATSVSDGSSMGSATITLAPPTVPIATAAVSLAAVSVDNGYGIPAIAVDAAGNIDEAWLAPNGVNFRRSTDGGVTFTSVPVFIPSDLSQNDQNNLLRIVVDANGNINLLWFRVLDPSATTVGYNVSRSIDNGATFSAPVEFAQGPHPTNGSNIPTLVVRSTGQLVLTWIDASLNVLVRTSNDGITFSTPATTVAATVPGAANEAAVAGPAGQIYLLWTQSTAPTACSISFSSSADGTTYSAPKTISTGAGAGCNSQPAAAVDAAGNLDVTWVADTPSLFFTRSIDAGAAFSAPLSIPTPASPAADEIVAGPDGGIYVLWVAGTTGEFSASQDSGATFSAAVPLGVVIAGGPPSFTVDACGNVTVIGESGNVETFYQRSVDGGLTFAAPVDVSMKPQSFEQQLAMDKSGNVNFTWALDGPQSVEFSRLATVCHAQ